MSFLFLVLLAAAPDDMAERVSRPVALQVPGMDAVRIQRDLVYTPEGRRLDAYAPPRAGRFPVVMLLHGGVPDEVPVRPKDWGLYRSWGKLLAASGFDAIIPDQRIGFPDPRLLLAARDVESASRYVRERAAQLAADPERTCLVAFSAGGPLLSDPIAGHPPRVRCLAAMYAFLDVRQSEPHRRHASPEELDRFSPLVQMERAARKMPPLFVARAGKDEVPTLLEAMDRFLASALAHDAPLQLVNLPETPHGFEADDTPRVREAPRALLLFLEQHLSASPTERKRSGGAPARRPRE